MIILITDGQPTVGVTQVGKILSNAKEANKSNARLFTFGVGYDINTLLLDTLAGDNRGTVGYIEPNEDLEVKVSNFFAKVNNPVLSDVKIDWGGVETDLVYPRSMPDLFHGSQVVLVGRYRPAAKRLTITGKVNGRERRFIYDDQKFPEKQTDHEFLPYLWAMRRVGYLLDQIRLNGESKELRDEIVELGTRYGIVTPYTSYLVLEPGMPRQISGVPGSTSESVTVVGGARGVPHSDARLDHPGVSGKSAVTASKDKAELREAEKVSQDEAASSAGRMRKIGSKTFYLRAGVWTDSEFKAEDKLPVVTLKFASDDYFNLIGQEPKLADFFALGQRVIVVWKGKLYRVEE
jgi:Ca-activated chloride channel family protein